MSKTQRAAQVQGLGPIVVMEKLSQLHFAADAPAELGLQVRKGDDTIGLAELEASIRTHGIIVPLVVKQYGGKLYVTGGNRRLKAARRINGDMDAVVPTINSDDFNGDTREIAMATNIALPPHPVDRFEVIASLVSAGMTAVDAQEHFALTSRQYGQIMKLGSLSQKIRDHWRNGDIDGETAQAFTLTDDQKEQDKAYATLLKNAWQGRVQAHAVRSQLTPTAQRDAGKLVQFVGVDACRDAGILKQEDMFSTSHTVTDMKVLASMVAGKFLSVAQQLTAQTSIGGWAWAMPADQVENVHYFGHVHADQKLKKPTAAEKKRLAEIETALQAIDDDPNSNYGDMRALEEEQEAIQEEIDARAFTPAQRAKAGCFLRINQQGELTIEYGRVKPEEAKKVAASERSAAKASSKKPGAAAAPALSNALVERLSKQLEAAVSSAVKHEPHIAVAALIAAFATHGHVVDVKAGSGGYDSDAEKNFAQVFAGAHKATVEQKLVMLTEVVVRTVSIGVFNAQAKSPVDDLGLGALLGAMNAKGVNAAIASAFDAEDYFRSVSGDMIVEAVRTAMGEDHAAAVAKMDKASKAKFATTNVPPTGWLPKQLRTAHYTGPTEAAAKPKAKAPAKAPAKKVAKKTVKKAVAKKPMAKKKSKK